MLFSRIFFIFALISSHCFTVWSQEEAEATDAPASEAPPPDDTSETPLVADTTEAPTDEESTGAPDYSRLVPPDPLLRYPQGGILVQYTKLGLDYILSMVEKAAAKMMRDFPIPNQEGTGYAVKNVNVTKFEQPTFKGFFINRTGMDIRTTIPKLEVTAAYSVGSGWFSTKGKVVVNIENLTIFMLMRVVRGPKGFPSVTLPHCAGKIGKFRIFFGEAGWTGTILNTLRGVMESIILTSVGDIICIAARNMTGLIDQVFLDFDKPLHEIIAPQTNKTATESEGIPMSVICGEVAAVKKTSPSASKVPGAAGFASQALQELDGLSIDLRMDQDGFFEPQHVVVGLRAQFLLHNQSSGLTPKQTVLAPTQRSLCFAVSQVVPNAFSIQGQKSGYFVLNKKVDANDIPAEFRSPFQTLCRKCDMHVNASTSQAPRVEFSKSGVRAVAKMEMTVQGHGPLNKKIKVAESTVDVDCSVNLTIRENAVYGTVSLGTIQVQVHHSGVGRLFDAPLNKLLRGLVPKVVWPVVEKTVNKILKEKGFKLPAACGLSFVNSQILYTDDHVVVCTDFSYDIEGFLSRFTEWQRQQQEKAAIATTTMAA